MRLEIDVLMDYQLARAEPVLLTIEAVHGSGQSIVDQTLEIQQAAFRQINDETVGATRVWANVQQDRLTLRYRATVDITRVAPPIETLPATDPEALPADVYAYLRPSRYCPSDLFSGFVEKTFGHLAGGARVAAIRDWVANALSYTSGSSTATTCARDTFLSREGVCRDFAHLVCALARASHIPARYTSGYGAYVSPPDFHAVAEVWLDGAWYIIDATGMSTPSGLAIIAAGRDAGDVAFMETMGPAYAISQTLCITER